MDLVVNNCFEDDRTATVEITHDGTGDTVFSETVAVPAESCSDVVDGVEREDVFEQAGTYTVAAEAEGFEPATTEREFSERAVEDNADSVTVNLDDDGITFL